MMALQGMPAIYFHSLVGTQNHLAGVEESGIPRRINRRKYNQSELEAALQGDTLQSKIFAGMQTLLRTRVLQSAFHPDAEQRYLESGSEHVLMFSRGHESGQEILVATNFDEGAQTIEVPAEFSESVDLLGSGICSGSLTLESAQIVWLERTKKHA